METEEPPRYLNATFSSSLPAYMHSESERIADSFKSGSYWSLKKLPHKIEPGKVQALRHVHTTNNILSKPPTIYRPDVVRKDFSKNEYIPTIYENDKVLEKGADEVEKVHIASASRKPGFWTSSRIKHKCEDIFEDIYYQFPAVLGPGVGVTRLESIVREDFSDMPKFLCGKVNPNQPKSTKEMAMDWVKKIHKLLSTDWPKLKFKVKLTKDDDLLVQFEIDEAILPAAMWPPLCKYMNGVVTRGLGLELGLRKRGDRWARVETITLPKLSTMAMTRERTKTTARSGVSTARSETNFSIRDMIEGNTYRPKDPRVLKLSKISRNRSAPDIIPPPPPPDDDFGYGSRPFTDPSHQEQHHQHEQTSSDSKTSEALHSQANSDFLSRPMNMLREEDHRLLYLNNTDPDADTVTTSYLTFALYTPWVNQSVLNASKAAAYADRQAAKKIADEQKQREKQFQLEQEELLLDDSGNQKFKPTRRLMSIVLNGSADEMRLAAEERRKSRKQMQRSRQRTTSTGSEGYYGHNGAGSNDSGGGFESFGRENTNATTDGLARQSSITSARKSKASNFYG